MRKIVYTLVVSFAIIIVLSCIVLAKSSKDTASIKKYDIPSNAITLNNERIDKLYKENGMYFTENNSLTTKLSKENILEILKDYINHYDIKDSQIDISYQNFTNLSSDIHEQPMWIVTLNNVDMKASGGNPFGKNVVCDNSETKVFIDDNTKEIIYMISMRYNNKNK
jgi:hypothetical protein